MQTSQQSTILLVFGFLFVYAFFYFDNESIVNGNSYYSWFILKNRKLQKSNGNTTVTVFEKTIARRLAEGFKLTTTAVATSNSDPFDTCILPSFDPFNNDAIRVFKPKTKSLDSCKPYIPTIIKLVNRTLINTSNDHNCKARCLNRIDDFRNKYENWVQVKHPNKFDCDIIETRCAHKNGTDVYGYLHAQIIKNKTVNNVNIVKGKQYDVYVLLLDSVGHTQFIRSLPLTHAFLENSFGAVTFPFINKVGINSRPNGIALWFGKQIEKIVRAPMNLPDVEPDWQSELYCGKKYIDYVKHVSIFKEFRDYGYKTYMAEDWPTSAVNWPNCPGFSKQPTDHYMKPYQIRQHKDKDSLIRAALSWENCHEDHNVILKHSLDFWKAYSDFPKLAFLWLSNLSHNDENGVNHADSDFMEFFAQNRKSFDNSFVIVMGDHGLRFGKFASTKIGALDANNPMLVMSVPRELRDSPIYQKLQENSRHLQTHYDTRATLLDILRYQPNSNYTSTEFTEFPNEKGSSYFRPQKLPRSCKSLPIPFHYCICQNNVTTLKSNSKKSIEIGKRSLSLINEMLKEANLSSMCQTFKLDKVNSISVYEPEYPRGTYEVNVRANKPSQAEFKLFVMRNGDKLSIAGFPNRQNKYGNNGNCTVYKYQSLCHCLNNV